MNSIEKLKASVTELISAFHTNPFDYLYESDLQAILFARAFDQFKTDRITLTGGYHEADNYSKPDDKSIQTVAVKSEYPGGRRFDIAIIDAERVETYNREQSNRNQWTNDRFWQQPVCAAVEIKYQQLSDKSKRGGLDRDLQKLREYSHTHNSNFFGIAMLFIQAKTPVVEPGANLSRLQNMDDIHSGIYAAIVGPSGAAWYKYTA